MAGEPYPGGWEPVLNVDPERAAETAGVRVLWPDGVTTTDLDPDFRPGLHPLGSIFPDTQNSRFVKYGTGLGWPQKGLYTFQVHRTGGTVIELSVDYLHRLLGRPEDIESTWIDRFTLRVSFTPPPDATHWSDSPSPSTRCSPIPSSKWAPTWPRERGSCPVSVGRGADTVITQREALSTDLPYTTPVDVTA